MPDPHSAVEAASHGYAVYKDILSKKLTRANSFLYNGVVFYIVKKFPDGKASKLYAAYLYPSGVHITADYSKDNLKVRLTARVQEIIEFMNKHELEGRPDDT